MLSHLDKNIIRKLQQDIPLVEEPYKVIAEELNISEKLLLDKINQFKKSGILRRMGATLNHIHAGFKANAMVVWKVPDERIKEVSKIIISFPQVTHCYRRPTFPNWPYNIFTMIHGTSKEDCEEIIKEISNSTGIFEYSVLYSKCELKKTSMKYFAEEAIK